jgi:hypothetical protein
VLKEEDRQEEKMKKTGKKRFKNDCCGRRIQEENYIF